VKRRIVKRRTAPHVIFIPAGGIETGSERAARLVPPAGKRPLS
jgi:hypothetical protein